MPCVDGQTRNADNTCVPVDDKGGASQSTNTTNTAKMWAAICGSVTATPFIFIIGYLAITFAYKSEKRMIVDEVKRHLVVADIATDINASKGLEMALVTPVQAVAAQLVWKCLQVWDGILGFRASSDSHGDRSGIWLSKFRTVRYASMLLAMQRCNAHLQLESGGDNTLFQAWTNASRCPAARDSLVMCVVHELLNISEAEAQALPKDPEVPGLQYKLCGMWQSCCTCCCRSGRKSSAHVELLWNPGSPAHV